MPCLTILELPCDWFSVLLAGEAHSEHQQSWHAYGDANKGQRRSHSTSRASTRGSEESCKHWFALPPGTSSPLSFVAGTSVGGCS